MLHKQFKTASLVVALSAVLVACGGGSDNKSSGQTNANQSNNAQTNAQTTSEIKASNGTIVKAQFIDSAVQGIDVYQDNKLVSTTDKDGYFNYDLTKPVQFKVGKLLIADVNLNEKILRSQGNVQIVTPSDIAKNDNHSTEILVTLQSLDKDNNPNNGIEIAKNNPAKPIEKLAESSLVDSTAQESLKAVLPNSTQFVLPEKAKDHHKSELKKVEEKITADMVKSPADLFVGTWKRGCQRAEDGNSSFFDIATFTITKVSNTQIKLDEHYLVFSDEHCSVQTEDKTEGGDTYTLNNPVKDGVVTHVDIAGEGTISVSSSTFKTGGSVFIRKSY